MFIAKKECGQIIRNEQGEIESIVLTDEKTRAHVFYKLEKMSQDEIGELFTK